MSLSLIQCMPLRLRLMEDVLVALGWSTKLDNIPFAPVRALSQRHRVSTHLMAHLWPQAQWIVAHNQAIILCLVDRPTSQAPPPPRWVAHPPPPPLPPGLPRPLSPARACSGFARARPEGPRACERCSSPPPRSRSQPTSRRLNSSRRQVRETGAGMKGGVGQNPRADS